MIQENEFIQLLLGAGVVIFMLVHRQNLRNRPSTPFLYAAVGMLVSGWVATILEGYLWPNALNLIEHSCYLVGTAMLFLWILRSRSRVNKP
jgi:hypothetical protein